MSVKRYRITADFYTYDDLDVERVSRAVAASINAYCPLGVVEGYPDIQEIATDSPFAVGAGDATTPERYQGAQSS